MCPAVSQTNIHVLLILIQEHTLHIVHGRVVDWQEPADEEGEDFDPTPVFVTSTLVSTVVFSWFCYEAYKLCCKMSPDEYLKGVIYFYTDMFYVCACCALLACLGGGGNGGAPPKDEEER